MHLRDPTISDLCSHVDCQGFVNNPLTFPFATLHCGFAATLDQIYLYLYMAIIRPFKVIRYFEKDLNSLLVVRSEQCSVRQFLSGVAMWSPLLSYGIAGVA